MPYTDHRAPPQSILIGHQDIWIQVLPANGLHYKIRKTSKHCFKQFFIRILFTLLNMTKTWLTQSNTGMNSLHIVNAWKRQKRKYNWRVTIMARIGYIQWNDDVHFVLDKHELLHFYYASSLKQQSAVRHVAPLRQIIWIPSPPVFILTP